MTGSGIYIYIYLYPYKLETDIHNQIVWAHEKHSFFQVFFVHRYTKNIIVNITVGCIINRYIK